MQADTLVIPAHCAFSEPKGEAVNFEENAPATGWGDKKQSIAWYGNLTHKGTLHLKVNLSLPPGESVTLKMMLSGQAKPGSAETNQQTGTVVVQGDKDIVVADFGDLTVEPGYWRFALNGIKKSSATFGSPVNLMLSGDAIQDADINRSKWRTPASVHLGYPLPPGTKAVKAYAEVTAKADPINTYYCALGFRRGYFGMQVNGPHERRIIFSIWDAGKEPTDPNKVTSEDRVELLAKGDGVVAERFGNEGTGGHSHLVYSWKTGQPQRFLVVAEPQGTHTVYSGYFYFPDRKQWGLIASFRAPRDGGYLDGLYSFNEVFGGDFGQMQRRAEFGRQWAQEVTGKWLELTTARFTHTARNEPLVRHDWGGGTDGDEFYLVNGGFLTEKTTFGDMFTRSSSKSGPPENIILPPPPAP